MSKQIVEVLLLVAVIITWICSLGTALMQDLFERLHYMATVSTISAFAILAAVIVEAGWGQAALKMMFIAIVLLLMNAVLTHATARAARVREHGRWQPLPREHIEGIEQEKKKR
jgi:monovalent cation/proton antiporter MnhG/PhaG subunit